MFQIPRQLRLLYVALALLIASSVFIGCADDEKKEEPKTEDATVAPDTTAPAKDTLPAKDTSATPRPDPIKTTPPKQ